MTKKWAGKKPTPEEIKQILADHEEWLDSEKDGDPPHNLAGIDLALAKLAGANLTEVELENANLQVANLEGANLSQAKLTGSNLSKANIMNANLIGTNFTGANLNGAHLGMADIFFTSFIRADLSKANLIYAKLKNVVFGGANITGADFTSALISQCYWEWVKCKSAITQEGEHLEFDDPYEFGKHMKEMDQTIDLFLKLPLDFHSQFIIDALAEAATQLNPENPVHFIEIKQVPGGIRCRAASKDKSKNDELYDLMLPAVAVINQINEGVQELVDYNRKPVKFELGLPGAKLDGDALARYARKWFKILKSAKDTRRKNPVLPGSSHTPLAPDDQEES